MKASHHRAPPRRGSLPGQAGRAAGDTEAQQERHLQVVGILIPNKLAIESLVHKGQHKVGVGKGVKFIQEGPV